MCRSTHYLRMRSVCVGINLDISNVTSGIPPGASTCVGCVNVDEQTKSRSAQPGLKSSNG